MPFKVTLAQNARIDDIEYPVYVQRKLDGIRCYAHEGKAYARSGKLIPNKRIQAWFSKCNLNLTDGELYIGDGGKTNFQQTTSVVMSEDAPIDNLKYCVFDFIPSGQDENMSYGTRLDVLRNAFCGLSKHIHEVSAQLVWNRDELDCYLSEQDTPDLEGFIIRGVNLPYKFGRSSKKNPHLWRLVTTQTEEAVLVNFDYYRKNNNERTKDSLGRTEKSSKLEGIEIDYERIGSLKLLSKDGKTFKVGTGFSDDLRRHLATPGVMDNMIGTLVTYEYKNLTRDGYPRFPVFKGFRSELDL